MSAFTNALCRAYDDIICVHGLSVVIKSANGMARLQGIFTDNSNVYTSGDVSVIGSDPYLKIKTADVERIGVVRGDTVQVNAVTYTVTQVSKRNSVISLLDLSEVKA